MDLALSDVAGETLRQGNVTPVRTVVVICCGNIAMDSRVLRQIRWLGNHYRVVAVGGGPPGVDGVEFIRCDFHRHRKSILGKAQEAVHLLTARYERDYWSVEVRQCLAEIAGVGPDLILANDVDTLPLACSATTGAKVILDAHEYAPGQSAHRLVWRMMFQGYYEHLCGKYLPAVDAMMTVSPGLAEAYEANYGVKPVVVTNAQDYEAIEPTPTTPDRIRIIYHGVAVRPRRIEDIIRITRYLDERFELNIVLVPGDLRYIRRLVRMVRRFPRVRFHDPVPLNEVVRFSSGFDIGLHLLPSSNFNHRHALPEKFLQFIQARLAIAIGPSPGMAPIVREHDCGVIADDFTPEAMARCLNQLTAERIDYCKGRSHRIAREMSSEANRTRLLDIVTSVLKG